MTTPIMQRLKAETRLYHQRVERQVNLEQICASPSTYRHLLQHFYGFYCPVEHKLAQLPWHALHFAYHVRQKCPLLAADLLVLGEQPPTLAQLPQCTGLPPLVNLAQALGCLYVLEGATLGGQIITRQVGRTLHLVPDRGCAFFASYGDQVGVMWQEFARLVAAYANTPARQETIVDSAIATFGALQHWLTRRAAESGPLLPLPSQPRLDFAHQEPAL